MTITFIVKWSYENKECFLNDSSNILCSLYILPKKTVKPDTPQNIGWLMKLAIDNDDYERFI